MLRFIIPAAILAVGLPPFIRWAWFHGWLPVMPSFLNVSTWLVTFMTTVIFVYLYRLEKPGMFVQFYLLSLVVKIFAALAYCLLMVFRDPSSAVANVIYFLILYVVFTVLEIALLYRKIAS